MAWQLMKGKKALTEPGPLPENWNSICGLEGFKDMLGDLSWIGPAYKDMAWVEVPEVPSAPEPADVKARAKILLADSDWSMLPDVPLTVGQKQDWIAYRRALRAIMMNPAAARIDWPAKPE